MDKTEYRMKLDELTDLVEKQDYRGALQIADSIDWRRVKSVRTLSMVADIYEMNKEYERCKEILLLAHNRSMIGKMVLYRLVEISLKLGETEDAAKYFSEFVDAAPNDNSRFILKYKIYKAQKAPLEDQIAILEDYKNREYTERWAYELAKLYSQAGQQQRCVETCDDLILWFAEGRYVTKAMELKMQYEPLTPFQQRNYDRSKKAGKSEAEAAKNVQTEKSAEAKLTPKPQTGKKKTKENTEELLQKMDSAGAAITQEASSAREQLEQSSKEDRIDYVPVNSPEFLGRTVDLREQLAKSIQEVFAGMKQPQEVAQQVASGVSALGDTGEIFVQDLEPEKMDTQAILNPEASKKILTKAEPVRAVSEDKKMGPSLENFDLDALLKETAFGFSEELASDKFKENDLKNEASETDELPDQKIEVSVPDSAEESADIKSDIAGESENFYQKEEPEKVSVERLKTQPMPDAEELEMHTRSYEPARESVADATREIKTDDIASDTKRFVAPEDTVPMSVEEVLREETPEERRIRVLNEERPEKLSDDQKRIFSYFSRVPGMDQQVLDALAGVYDHAGEKTSRHGNVAIMGGYGTGKTRLSESIVRAICKDLGLTAAKYARIDAADLNKKDPAMVVAKMSGGFLLIERAGLLYPDVIQKLDKALEFRTDSMIVIIEDEKTSMRGLLRNNPEFAKKFDTVISIPVFTNDELVTFARTYARENGYKMDEMGVLALYTLIGNNQTENEPITIAKVKTMVDKAMSRAGKGTRRFGRRMSGKRTDDQNRIILYEKDFDV